MFCIFAFARTTTILLEWYLFLSRSLMSVPEMFCRTFNWLLVLLPTTDTTLAEDNISMAVSSSKMFPWEPERTFRILSSISPNCFLFFPLSHIKWQSFQLLFAGWVWSEIRLKNISLGKSRTTVHSNHAVRSLFFTFPVMWAARLQWPVGATTALKTVGTIGIQPRAK